MATVLFVDILWNWYYIFDPSLPEMSSCQLTVRSTMFIFKKEKKLKVTGHDEHTFFNLQTQEEEAGSL